MSGVKSGEAAHALINDADHDGLRRLRRPVTDLDGSGRIWTDGSRRMYRGKAPAGSKATSCCRWRRAWRPPGATSRCKLPRHTSCDAGSMTWPTRGYACDPQGGAGYAPGRGAGTNASPGLCAQRKTARLATEGPRGLESGENRPEPARSGPDGSDFSRGCHQLDGGWDASEVSPTTSRTAWTQGATRATWLARSRASIA